MNSDIFEIIGQLVKKLLHEEEVEDNEEELISLLQEEGYDIDDINQAFEFIFSSTEMLEIPEKELNELSTTEEAGFKNRVLDVREKFQFNLNVRGTIIKLLAFDLITEEELERTIARGLSQHSSDLDILEFWQLLKKVIDDEFRLSVIEEKVPEFKIATAGQKEVVH